MKKKKKPNNIISKVIIGIISIIVLYIVFNVVSSLIEKNRVKEDSINYFSERFNVDKSKIKINGYHYSDGKSLTCMWMCYDQGELSIEYDDKKYVIYYEKPDKDTIQWDVVNDEGWSIEGNDLNNTNKYEQ